MSKQYLKMADVIDGCVTHVCMDLFDGVGNLLTSSGLAYAAHAINSHDELVAEVERLCEFERDALRYRWLMQNTKLGIGRNGKDWDLQVDSPAPDSISEVGEWIDNRMDGRM